MTPNDPTPAELDLDPLVTILNPFAYLGASALLPALHAAQEQSGHRSIERDRNLAGVADPEWTFVGP